VASYQFSGERNGEACQGPYAARAPYFGRWTGLGDYDLAYIFRWCLPGGVKLLPAIKFQCWFDS
jgi:hypothetical protein